MFWRLIIALFMLSCTENSKSLPVLVEQGSVAQDDVSDGVSRLDQRSIDALLSDMRLTDGGMVDGAVIDGGGSDGGGDGDSEMGGGLFRRRMGWWGRRSGRTAGSAFEVTLPVPLLSITPR